VRVLCVATDYPPHRAGGYELQCAGAVAHLRARGHAVRVLTSSRGAASAAADARGDVHRDLIRFPAVPERVQHAEAQWAEERNGAAFEAHLADFGPDVLSWWRLGELTMSLLARARAAGVPGVGMVCDPWWIDGPRRDPWARRTRTGPDLGAAEWLFVSRALRAQLGGAGRVVTAGIELAALPAAPARPWGGRLLYAGRLSRLKGVDTAVAALRELPAGVSLDVVGDGDPAYLAELRAAAPPGRAAFAPARPPAAMAATYAAADAVLFPARWAEPWGLVPLEAMACGRPVIASGTGGSAEYLRDGGNALVVAPDDPAGLARAVRRLAADPALRARLRAGGLATACEHPAARSHAAVADHLEAAASRRMPTSRSA